MTVTTRAAAARSASPVSATSNTSSRQGSPAKSNGSPSDGEGRNIRPTRQKLAKTSINASEKSTQAEEIQGRASLDSISDAGSAPKANGDRGRLRRKRSFEEVGEEHSDEKPVDVATKHQRKRSRDTRPDVVEADNGSFASASDDSDGAQSGADTTVGPANPTSTPSAAGDNLSSDSIAKPSARNNETVDVTTESTAVPKVAEVAHSSLQATQLESTGNTDTANDSAEATGKLAGGAQTAITSDTAKSPTTLNTTDESTKKIPSSSGFANLSTQSPFAALGQSKSSFINSQSQTSPKTFASSGFAALAGSSQSPFGTLASKSAQTEKSAEDAPATGFTASPPSAFASLGANAGGPSPFASAGTGFGSVFSSQRSFGDLGNGFMTTSAFGGGFGKPLSSFASSDVSNFARTSALIKPIGVPAEHDADEADGSGEEDEDGKQGDIEEDEQDERFYHQNLGTGEEDEDTIFKGRGKLYMMGDDKAWKERGTGDFKVNSRVERTADDEDEVAKTTARFLMRVDGSHRLVLNSPITKDIKVEDPARGAPRGKTAVFLGWVEGKLVTLQLKMRDNIQTTALSDAVNQVQAMM